MIARIAVVEIEPTMVVGPFAIVQCWTIDQAEES